MDLSIIIPVFNEQDNISHLHAALQQALSSLTLAWEVLYVDDGSTDQSIQILDQLYQADLQHVCVIQLRRNFGQTAAIASGIEHAKGAVMVLMDADLQNDPTDIPMLLSFIEQGYDLVSGWRIKRADGLFLRRLPSQMANALISWVTGVHLHDYGCTLKAYRREVITEFRLYGEMHRFIPVYAHMVGARIIEVPVKHHPRRFGKTKYGLGRTAKVLLDLVTVKYLMTYSSKPIYLFGGTGILLVSLSLIIFSYLAFMKIFFQAYFVESPLLLLSVMLFILGFQSVLMGLIAEMLARTYHESQHKPPYTIRSIHRQDGPVA